MNVADEIEKLVKLRDRGVLSEEEFQELKAETLGMEKPSALVEKYHNNSDTKEIEIETVVTDEPEPEEEFQAPEAEKLGMEKPATLVKNDNNNSNIKEIKIEKESIVTDESIEKTSIFKNIWVKAISVLLAVIACVSLGVWIARQNNESVANTTSENKTEAAQKQDAADAEYVKLEAKLDKLQAAYNNKQNNATAESPNTKTISEDRNNAVAATEPTNETQGTQTPTVTEKEAPPITEVASTQKTEVSQPSPAKELIQYQSTATPFVLQMLESARDTDKLFAAKSSLEGLEKPAKGDRKTARKLNDSAIALMGEKNIPKLYPYWKTRTKQTRRILKS